MVFHKHNRLSGYLEPRSQDLFRIKLIIRLQQDIVIFEIESHSSVQIYLTFTA